MKQAKNITETMPMILQLNLLEKDLLFTGFDFSVSSYLSKYKKITGALQIIVSL